MPDPQVLHDDYGDAITIEADGIATGLPDGRASGPAVIVIFWDSPFHLGSDQCVKMRLSGERLAAFTEAIDRHAGYLAALAEKDLCCGCNKPLPESMAEWWLTSDNHAFCTSECAKGGVVCGE